MRFLRFLVILLATALFALPVLAQKQTTITLDDGTQLALPAGWQLSEWEGDGILVDDGSASILLLDTAMMDDLVTTAARDDIGEALVSAYESFYGDRLNERDVEFTTLAEYSAAQWFFEDQDDNEGAFIVVELEEGVFLALDLVAPRGDRDDVIATAEDMLASLTTGGDTSASGGATGVLTPATSSTSSEPCTVSVESDNTAALRVGPGTNRSSVAFLPAGQEFEVIGTATANDGSEWFKLDKAEAAPRSAANEVWVAREDVTESGDCAAVADAAAPPVVPITNNPPPTPAPSGDSGATTTTTTSSGGGSAQPGSWTLVFSRQTNGSCAGTGNFVLNTQDVWSNWTEADFVFSGSLSFSGANVLFAGDTYRPTGSANQYVASFDLGGGYNNQIYITFNSPTTFVGQMTGNASFDGIACSISTPLSGRRN